MPRIQSFSTKGTLDLPVIAARSETTSTPHARRTAGSVLTSAILHVVFLLLASFIILDPLGLDRPTKIEAGFNVDAGQASPVVINTELTSDQVDPQLAELAASSATQLFREEISTAKDSLSIDLSEFGFGQTEGTEPVPGIAEGIQDRVRRAGGKTGEVQFTLSWHSLNDLDLHVITPSGEHISHGHRKSRCHGELDVDMNVQAESSEPVENIRWLQRGAPMGRYTILIHQYRWRTGRTDALELLVNMGKESQLLEQTIHASKPLIILRFQYVKATMSEARRKQLLEEYLGLQAREEKLATDMFARAVNMEAGELRDRILRQIIGQYPHTDASIDAMQLLKADPKPNSR
ncbi:MAG: hypothetical protein KDA91_16655 [Planctomycetaceae bacterium]|nr:hypothetical protein [Planctomycetaceae bacterium]